MDSTRVDEILIIQTPSQVDNAFDRTVEPTLAGQNIFMNRRVHLGTLGPGVNRLTNLIPFNNHILRQFGFDDLSDGDPV